MRLTIAGLLDYSREHLGDMGGEGDVRDIVEIGIGTCLTVFLKKVTD